MANAFNNLILAAVILTEAHAQVASSQTTQAQQQPCSPSANTAKPVTKTPSALNDPNSKIGKIIGKYSPFDPNAVFAPKPKPAVPCPPPPAQAAAVTAPATPPLRLPQDSLLTVKCNPQVAAKGASPATFVLPDPNAFEMPGKNNAWEADTVIPDLSAKQPCFVFKVDPATHRYWLPQQ